MKKILIIGEHSYIGNSFKNYIDKKINTLRSDKWIMDTVGASNGKWKDIEFNDYDCVIHAAAIVHRKENKSLETIYYSVNCALAVAVAQKAKESKVGQFVFFSTMAVFGNKYEQITVNTKPQPFSYYGKSKLQAEKEIAMLESDEFKITIIRPPIVYGPGCNGNFAKLIKLARLLPMFPLINNKRSMIFIGNLNKFLKSVIEQEKSGVFHPQNSEHVRTYQIIVEVRSVLLKRTWMVYKLDRILLPLTKRVRCLGKIFGNFYYDYELTYSNIEQEELSEYNFIDSIQLSLFR